MNEAAITRHITDTFPGVETATHQSVQRLLAEAHEIAVRRQANRDKSE